MDHFEAFLSRHRELTRRYFLKLGAAGLAMPTMLHWASHAYAAKGGSLMPSPEEKAKRFGSYLTPDEQFADVSRGEPLPHELPDDKIPPGTHGFDGNGRPTTWPMRFSAAHWAGVHPGLPAGKYNFRCRAIDGRGFAQPMPRPLRKSGSNAIEQFSLEVAEA